MALLDKIKSAVAESMSDQSAPRLKDLETQNTTLTQRITALETENATLKTENATAQAAVKTSGDAQVVLSNRVTALETETAQLKADKLALEAKLADPKSEINRRAGLKAAEIAAAQGGAPIAALPAENPAAPKTEASTLKGHARIAAATKAQLDRDYPISAPAR